MSSSSGGSSNPPPPPPPGGKAPFRIQIPSFTAAAAQQQQAAPRPTAPTVARPSHPPASAAGAAAPPPRPMAAPPRAYVPATTIAAAAAAGARAGGGGGGGGYRPGAGGGGGGGGGRGAGGADLRGPPPSWPGPPRPRPQAGPPHAGGAGAAGGGPGAGFGQPVPSRHNPSAGVYMIAVSPRQEGNAVLKHIKNVPWQFTPGITPDYVLGAYTCCLYISLRFHLLNPEYLIRRIKELRRDYRLRLILCLVDVEDSAAPLLQINRMALLENCTLLLAWSTAEAARYLETFKAYENKAPDSIQERVDADYASRLSNVLTSIRSVNKTDAMTLSSNFGSLAGIMRADKTDLHMCPGLGEVKVQRLWDTFHEPFIKKRAAASSASASSSTTTSSPQAAATATATATMTAAAATEGLTVLGSGSTEGEAEGSATASSAALGEREDPLDYGSDEDEREAMLLLGEVGDD